MKWESWKAKLAGIWLQDSEGEQTLTCGVQLDDYLSIIPLGVLSPVDAEQFQRIAKALADPRRFEILEHIAKQSEVACRRLCDCFPVRQATISHHLKELASAGLVESRRDGQFVYYRIRPMVLETYMDELGRKMAVPMLVRHTQDAGHVTVAAAPAASRAAVPRQKAAVKQA
jgi:ArsR family transcriptional regulator